MRTRFILRARLPYAARIRAFVAVGLGAVLVITAGSALAAPVSEPAQTPITVTQYPPLKVSQVPGSVAYLIRRFGISEQDALRRLELQRIAPELQEKLEAAFPDEYAGTWIDQEGGGYLMVAATQPVTVDEALRGLSDAAHIRTVKARWSLRQLRDSQTRLEKALNNGFRARTAETAIDTVNNVVGVYRRAGAVEAGRDVRTAADHTAAERSVAAPDVSLLNAVAAEGGRAALRQMVVGQEKIAHAEQMVDPVGPTCNPGTYISDRCYPPMRGGMRLDILRNQQGTDPSYNNPWWGQCTNGFNMHDDYRGWDYVMTAGHCMTGKFKVGQTRTYDLQQDALPISYEVFNFENGPTCDTCTTYPYDYSIQPFDGTYFNYWLGPYPKNRVVSYCWWWESSRPENCNDGTFAITGHYGYFQIGMYWIVCATGSGADDPSGYNTNTVYHPGTRCGAVTGLDGGIKTDICSRPGDSGGPLFSEIDGKAYGILYGGTYTPPGTHRSCPTSAPWEYSQYSSISYILSHVKDQTIRAEGRDYRFRLNV